jgi:2-oxoglutarate dehydrogenase E1 component
VAPTELDGLNAGFAAALLEDYLADPSTVPEEWRTLFEHADAGLLETLPGLRRLLELRGDGQGNGNGHAAVAEPAAAPATPDDELLGAVAAAMALVKAHRTHGHLAADLDPLGSAPPGDPALEPERLEPRLTPELQARVPADVLRMYVPGATLAEAFPRLQETYTGTIAYEIEHLSSHEQRLWLRQAIESGAYRTPLAAEDKRALLARLTETEGLERFLRRSFLGQKSFSLEGLEVLIPMLDESLELAAEAGAREIVIGMAHRGRLNVFAHTLGMPYEAILVEFEGEKSLAAVVADPEGGSGDVKYHLGGEARRQTAAGELRVVLASNPSHLEIVDPVVEGRTRAAQTDRTAGAAVHDPSVALPILIHGDAAFAGQGVVAETLNLQELAGYTTGGTLHLIANNQIGFTTEPHESRSTRYSSDLAKGFDVPIVHVNADDPEAALSAIRLAMAFRRRFATDVVVDVVGYRRFGHNEQDEPAYTQPQMVATIEAHPPVRELYAARLAAEGVVTAEESQALDDDMLARLRAAHDRLKETLEQRVERPGGEERTSYEGDLVATAVAEPALRGLNDELLRVPDGFTVNAKLAKSLQRRHDALDDPEGGIDWGHAESLAFASLVCEGIPIRITGQDTERGTFSHRHVMLHDAQTGQRYAPMQHLEEAQASFEIHNSPLSELACVGFEYGYATEVPHALVLWEAQFGDFVNGAQILIDQFVSSGLSKWRETSRLTLLLPHAYEGNGPEHSSARVERFLQLAAQENIRIANCTTAAQYFHLLRRQALYPTARPLVIFTPKGLLRLRQASSPLEELATGRFHRVLDDPRPDKESVRRLVLCTGKLYYDIAGHARYAEADGVAVARVELLYPFPRTDLAELVAGYPALEEIVWTQEEPQNMGPWRAIRHRLEEARPEGVPLRYVGRPWRASPSEGYPTAHLQEQDRIVRDVLSRD